MAVLIIYLYFVGVEVRQTVKETEDRIIADSGESGH
jgi:hypothetical protein